MQHFANPYAVTLLLSALAAIALAAASWARRRDARGGRDVAVLSLAATAWVLSEAVWLEAGSGPAGLWGLRLVATTGALLPPLLLAYAFAATRLLPGLRRVVPALAAAGSVLVVGLALGPVGGLSLWSDATLQRTVGRLVLVGHANAYGWAAAGFEGLMTAAALALLVLGTVRTPGPRRAPMVWALAGAALPMAVETVRVLATAWPPQTAPATVGAGIAPAAMVLAPAALALGQGLFGGMRYRSPEGDRRGPPKLAPLPGRAELIDQLELPVLVVDNELHVSYANAAATLLLRPRGSPLGENVRTLIGAAPALLEALELGMAAVQPLELMRGGGARPYEAWLTPLAESSAGYQGTLVALIDRTPARPRQADGGPDRVEAHRSTALLGAFRDILLGIARGDRLGILLDVALTGAASSLGAAHGAVYLVEPASDTLVRRTALGAFERLDEPALRRDEGLVGRVWAASRSIVLDAFPEPYEGGPPAVAGATVAIPLRFASRTVGVLLLARQLADSEPFDSRQLEALEGFADLAALAVRDRALRERSERTETELEWLDRLDALIARGAPDTEVLEMALQAAREAADFDKIVAWLADGDGRTLEARAWIGAPTGPEAGLKVRLDGSVPLLEEAFLGEHEIVLQGGPPLPARLRPSGPAASSPLVRAGWPVVLPLRGSSRVLGVLLADDRREGVELAARLRVLRRLAVRAGQALDRALTSEQQRLQEDAVRRTRDQLEAVLAAREGLIGALDIGYFEADLRGNLTRVSPEMARLAGGDESELKGARLADLAAPEAEAVLVDLLGRALRGARPVRRAAWALLVPRAGVVPVELTIGVLHDERGKPSGYFGLVSPRGR